MKAGRLHCRQFFNGNPDAFKAFDDPAYADTYVQVLKSFTSLAAKQNWNRSGHASLLQQ